MSDAVVCEITIDAPASLAFELFTDPALLVQWIGIDAALEPEAGGLFRFEFFDGEFCGGRYLEVVRPRRIVFSWGWESGALPVAPGSTTVDVDLEELEDYHRPARPARARGGRRSVEERAGAGSNR